MPIYSTRTRTLHFFLLKTSIRFFITAVRGTNNYGRLDIYRTSINVAKLDACPCFDRLGLCKCHVCFISAFFLSFVEFGCVQKCWVGGTWCLHQSCCRLSASSNINDSCVITLAWNDCTSVVCTCSNSEGTIVVLLAVVKRFFTIDETILPSEVRVLLFV